MAITSAMFLVVVVALLWWRRIDIIRDMPRRPETVGTVISYLCASVMTGKLAKKGDISTNEALEALSKKDRWISIVGSGRKISLWQMGQSC